MPDLKGLQLACKYSWNCKTAERLRASKILLEAARGAKTDWRLVEKVLLRLKAFGHYLQISSLNNIDDVFAQKIISHYWKGAPDLKNGLHHNFTTIMDIPREIIDPEEADNCMVRVVKVVNIENSSAIIEYCPLEKRDSQLFLGKTRTKKVSCLLCLPKKGNWVSMHFSSAIEILSPQEKKSLEKITTEALNYYNK